MLNITTLTLLLIISPLISLALTKTSFLMCLLNLKALMLGMITMSFLTNFMGAHTGE